MFFSKKKETEIKDSKINESDKVLNNNLESEIDPIAEADVYLAYGRKEQALKILNEALESGKIVPAQYDKFIKEHFPQDSAETEFLEKITHRDEIFFHYYISLTAGNNQKVRRCRLLLKLKNEINTKVGIEELETQIDNYIKDLFEMNQELVTWTIDSYIEMNIE